VTEQFFYFHEICFWGSSQKVVKLCENWLSDSHTLLMSRD